MAKTMIIETEGLFLASESSIADPIDQMHNALDTYVMQGEDKLYPTPFMFDMCRVTCIYKSSHFGYTTINFGKEDSFAVNIEWEECKKLFRKSRELLEND